MRHVTLLLISITNSIISFAQKLTVRTEILTSKQVSNVFTDSLKEDLNLAYPIFRVYKYSDKSGQFYCVLTQSQDSIGDKKDTFNCKIACVNYKIENRRLHKVWELSDNILKTKNEETTIWFWTKYIDFNDFDMDSLADPIIVYGTSAMNGFDDGRIKFIICYKGQKIAIRHQNGVRDFERETHVDKAFYSLPQKLQSAIKQKMETMTKKEQAIFPFGWQNAMQNKKTFFSERKK